MGQGASKKNTTAPSKPEITEPRLPGYWDRLSSKPLKPKPPAYSYLEKPAYTKPIQSHHTWTQEFNRHRNEFNSYLSRSHQNGVNLIRRNQEINQITDELRQKRSKAESGGYTQASSVPRPSSLHSILPIVPRLQTRRENDAKYFSIKKRRPELTDEMVKHILAMKAAPHTCLLAEIDGVQILGKDVRTLIGLNWLNDEIINAYMTLLVHRGQKPGFRRVHTFNTFFYPKLRESGYNSVRRWTRKVDIFDFDFITVPVHLGNHWTLVFIDFKQRTISFYDSLGGYQDQHCDILLDYLRNEMSDKKKQEFSDSGWQLLNRSCDGIPQQDNCSDCGVFTCIYAEHLTRESELDFSQEDMPYYRDRMIYEITKQRILE